MAVVTVRWDGMRSTRVASGVFCAGRSAVRVRRSRVVLAPRCWRQVCVEVISRGDGDNKPAHRGEREVSRKAIAQGMSECSPLTCMLVCAILAHFGTRDRGCSAHPAFLGSLCFVRRDKEFAKARAKTRRENNRSSSLPRGAIALPAQGAKRRGRCDLKMVVDDFANQPGPVVMGTCVRSDDGRRNPAVTPVCRQPSQ